jgi:hypothetical protein
VGVLLAVGLGEALRVRVGVPLAVSSGERLRVRGAGVGERGASVWETQPGAIKGLAFVVTQLNVANAVNDGKENVLKMQRAKVSPDFFPPTK